jgi:hypothetical protein
MRAMSATAIKVLPFTAAQHIEMLRLGLNPATVEARWLRLVYMAVDRNPSDHPVPVIDRDADGYTIILTTGRHFRVETPPGHPLRNGT